jgi:hypothetical protein
LNGDWSGVLVDNYASAGWWLGAESTMNVEIRLQDIFEVPLPRGDVYILGSILHDLNDASANLLLRSIVENGKVAHVLVIERSYDPGLMSDSARDLDIRLLFGGQERSTRQLMSLLTSAGLRQVDASETIDRYRLLLGRSV